jgi:hypothetical protein
LIVSCQLFLLGCRSQNKKYKQTLAMDATFEQWVKKLEAVDQIKLVQRIKNWNNGFKKNWRCGFKNCKNVVFLL